MSGDSYVLQSSVTKAAGPDAGELVNPRLRLVEMFTNVDGR
ncbi:MAG: hypothetical protein OSB03_15975 [Vicinamibacterales bacterium]|nr:hypothetical protein [Vicinamibacterales bacterium]